MTDKVREEFEAWFCSTIPYPIAKESWFAIMSCDDYIITEVQAAWAGWKASRAALCVELPKQYSTDSIGAAYCVDAVIDSLDSAWVRHK